MQLTHAFLEPKEHDPWERHSQRLSPLGTSLTGNELAYNVSAHVVYTADYGVPQSRERVFIIAFRADLDSRWRMLEPTHSRDALLVSKYVSGDYWTEHSLVPEPPPIRQHARVKALQGGPSIDSSRWLTVRDALADLPSPGESCSVSHHEGISSARSYTGHTGSSWDEPSKTIKAGTHGVAGGENMVRNTDGVVRYFTVRELARLQTFPDAFQFSPVWSIETRQLGNAIPVAFAELVAARVKVKEARLPRPESEGDGGGSEPLVLSGLHEGLRHRR